jgi:L-seryl-tRNA(Ser) seleniumtransferase
VSPASNPGLFRKLPSTDEVLHRPEVLTLAASNGTTVVADAVRTVLEHLRDEIADNHLDENSLDLALTGIGDAVARQLLRSLRYSLRPVINATGVILHTNLGRAPLAQSAIDHAREVATTYSNLEFNLETGDRGKRDVHVDRLFQKLFEDHVGAATVVSPDERRLPATSDTLETALSTIVVNNNAAAVLLALNSLAEGGEVIVSRGELVEIGGSFRIPEVMAKSHATMREVGTTNRTRIADYERAISERTRLLLRVHRSNFAITGFTEQPALPELVDLARRRNIPLVEDLGSGALFDLREIGVDNESSVFDSLRAGIGVVTYSGDKLLGGPQAGLITGRVDLVARMRSNSLFRALRVDKLTYAALETTLLAYMKHDHNSVPALRMMHLAKDEITARAEALLAALKSSRQVSERWILELIDGESVIGGGAAPTAALPTTLIALTHKHDSADELCRRLRQAEPPVIARVEQNRVLLDLRTVFPEQDALVFEALHSLN